MNFHTTKDGLPNRGCASSLIKGIDVRPMLDGRCDVNVNNTDPLRMPLECT